MHEHEEVQYILRRKRVVTFQMIINKKTIQMVQK
jgi:hypothetical protein